METTLGLEPDTEVPGSTFHFFAWESSEADMAGSFPEQHFSAYLVLSPELARLEIDTGPALCRSIYFFFFLRKRKMWPLTIVAKG